MKKDRDKWIFIAGLAFLLSGLGIGLITWTHPYCSQGANLYISALAILCIGSSLILVFISIVKRSSGDLRHMTDGLGRKEPGKKTF